MSYGLWPLRTALRAFSRRPPNGTTSSLILLPVCCSYVPTTFSNAGYQGVDAVRIVIGGCLPTSANGFCASAGTDSKQSVAASSHVRTVLGSLVKGSPPW